MKLYYIRKRIKLAIKQQKLQGLENTVTPLSLSSHSKHTQNQYISMTYLIEIHSFCTLEHRALEKQRTLHIWNTWSIFKRTSNSNRQKQCNTDLIYFTKAGLTKSSKQYHVSFLTLGAQCKYVRSISCLKKFSKKKIL